MKNSEEAIIKELQRRATALQSKIKTKQETQSSDEFISVKVQKSQARFERIKNPGASDTGRGEFFLQLDITALKEAVYIPLSIASGKKQTGFIYQIEGTGEGVIETTDISSKGDNVTKITLGTLLYTKVPAGKTASLRLVIEISGRISKEYRVVVNRINYKLDPSEARYKKLDMQLSTKLLKFL